MDTSFNEQEALDFIQQRWNDAVNEGGVTEYKPKPQKGEGYAWKERKNLDSSPFFQMLVSAPSPLLSAFSADSIGNEIK